MIKRGLRYVDELSGAVKHQLAQAYRAKDLLGYGLRQRLKQGYSAADFRADLLAALTVGVVALPLSMALAMACGVPPQHGLYAAIIAGVICALLGGTQLQITGPTAAFVVILVPIVHKYGLSGLLVAGLMAGVMLVAMGLARLGRLMQFIPHPVTTGFTAGIALVIAILQLKDLLGIRLASSEGVVEYIGALWQARDAANLWDLGIGVVTIALLLGLPKILKRVPAPIVALVAVSLVVVLCGHLIPGFHATTIGSTFEAAIGSDTVRGIPPLPPLPILPWDAAGPEVASTLSGFPLIRALLPAAFAIAMLGAIESLRTAVAADGMTGTQHDPNSELIALGVANIVVPFFGGIAVTGALARTATNIRAGARSPLAAAFQAVFVLACTIALAPLVAYLPMAALAGLLIIVARNLSEARHFVRLTKIAPRSDVMVMWTCFVLTVAFDMVIAVTFGVVLAALLFMRRMAVFTRTNLASLEGGKYESPPGVRVYEIAGPLFFGAAKTAMEALHAAGGKDHTMIISMQHVPTIDATGLVALETVLDRLARSKVQVIFAGLAVEVAEIFERAGIKRDPGRIAYAPDIETAISMAIVHAARISTFEKPVVNAA